MRSTSVGCQKQGSHFLGTRSFTPQFSMNKSLQFAFQALHNITGGRGGIIMCEVSDTLALLGKACLNLSFLGTSNPNFSIKQYIVSEINKIS